MNNLIQLENGIIGSQKACLNLAQMNFARILVLSDSHGRKEIVRMILKKYGKSCDAVIFSGDGVCDFIDCLDKAFKEPEFMEYIPPVVVMVKGNNDPCEFSAYFNPSADLKKEEGQIYFQIKIPEYVVLTAAGRKIFITHGHEYNVYSNTYFLETTAAENGCSAAIFGHLHFPMEIRHKIYVMNPGSCALPRRNSYAGFSILTIEGNNISSAFIKTDFNKCIF